MAENNQEFRRENVEMILPLLRFSKMTPTELLSLESSPLMDQFSDILKPKLAAGMGHCRTLFNLHCTVKPTHNGQERSQRKLTVKSR